jgi:hypothetical protein
MSTANATLRPNRRLRQTSVFRRIWSSGMWRRVVRSEADVSEKHTDSIFRAEESEKQSANFETWVDFQRTTRRHIPVDRNLHLQLRISYTQNTVKTAFRAYYSTLKMAAISFSETQISVTSHKTVFFTQATMGTSYSNSPCLRFESDSIHKLSIISTPLARHLPPSCSSRILNKANWEIPC